MIAGLVMSLAIGFALVLTRAAAFVAVSPFPGPTTPVQIKIGLSLLLAVAMTPYVTTAHLPAFGLGLVGPALAELATGLAIGFIFRIALVAADVLGASLGHALGLTLAQTFDPTSGATSDPMARLVTAAGTLVMLATGAHRVVLASLVSSVRAVPVGEGFDLGELAPATLQWIARSFECGLGLALPVITVSLGVQLALAVASRAAPALQIFSVGISLTLASGAIVLLASLSDMLAGIAAQLERIPEVLAAAFAR